LSGLRFSGRLKIKVATRPSFSSRKLDAMALSPRWKPPFRQRETDVRSTMPRLP
jgi:hypothetical protein